MVFCLSLTSLTSLTGGPSSSIVRRVASVSASFEATRGKMRCVASFDRSEAGLGRTRDGCSRCVVRCFSQQRGVGESDEREREVVTASASTASGDDYVKASMCMHVGLYDVVSRSACMMTSSSKRLLVWNEDGRDDGRDDADIDTTRPSRRRLRHIAQRRVMLIHTSTLAPTTSPGSLSRPSTPRCPPVCATRACHPA